MEQVKRFAKVIILVAQFVASGLFLSSLIRLDILQTWQLAGIAGILIVAFLFSTHQLLLATRTRKATKIICVILSLLCIAASLLAHRYVSSANEFLENVTSEQSAEEQIETPKEPFIVYISGSDSQNGLSDSSRSDVNILAVVNPEKGKILLISIPRDYYVQLHGTTGAKDKLTHAGIYGIEMSKTTIEDLLNIEINRTIKVSFDTLKNVVDTLGGIEITSDTAMTLTTDDHQTCTYSIGAQQVNGACALRFARERKSYESGDRHRGENQEQIIASIVKKLQETKNLVKWPEILAAAKNTFTTTFTFDEITSFVRAQLSDPKNWQVESISLDGAGSNQPTYSMGGQLLYVMIPDENTIKSAQVKINEYLSAEAESATE